MLHNQARLPVSTLISQEWLVLMCIVLHNVLMTGD